MTLELKKRLNYKQDAFCRFYFQNGNATQAAIQAGYSQRSAGSIGGENLQKPVIQERLAELQAKALDASVASVIERKQTLSKVVRCTYADFTDEKGNLNIADREKLRTPAIQEIRSSTTRSGTELSLKLRDPIAAIAELNKMERIGQTETTINNFNEIKILIVRAEPKVSSVVIEGKLPGVNKKEIE